MRPGSAAGSAAGESRPGAHPRTDHPEHLVAGALGGGAAGGSHLPHRHPPVPHPCRLAGGVLARRIEKIEAGIAVSESARNVVVQHLGRDAVVIPNGIAVQFSAPAPAAPRLSPR